KQGLRMGRPFLIKVPEYGQMGIDGVEQPEIEDFRRREVAEIDRNLVTASGEQGNSFASHRFQILASPEVDHGRHKVRVQLEHAGSCAVHTREAEDRSRRAGFTFDENPQILPRYRNGLFGSAGVLIPDLGEFRPVAGIYGKLRVDDV